MRRSILISVFLLCAIVCASSQAPDSTKYSSVLYPDRIEYGVINNNTLYTSVSDRHGFTQTIAMYKPGQSTPEYLPVVSYFKNWDYLSDTLLFISHDAGSIKSLV